MSDRTFLAYGRDKHGNTTREVGVDYDHATEIDERNGWHDDKNAPVTRSLETVTEEEKMQADWAVTLIECQLEFTRNFPALTQNVLDRVAARLQVGSPEPDIAELGVRAIREIFFFIFDKVRLCRSEGYKKFLRRMFMAVWNIDSTLLLGADGMPMSLEQIGKLPFVQCTKCNLSYVAQDFQKLFNFRSRLQKSDSAKNNYRKAREAYVAREKKKKK